MWGQCAKEPAEQGQAALHKVVKQLLQHKSSRNNAVFSSTYFLVTLTCSFLKVMSKGPLGMISRTRYLRL